MGIDGGSTFTDFVLYDEAHGALQVCKCLTTPAAPAQAALQGMATLLMEVS
jgi:N-methylhydantoinase A/oxoprolinase/acetone carboxylase beta subunit